MWNLQPIRLHSHFQKHFYLSPSAWLGQNSNEHSNLSPRQPVGVYWTRSNSKQLVVKQQHPENSKIMVTILNFDWLIFHVDYVCTVLLQISWNAIRQKCHSQPLISNIPLGSYKNCYLVHSNQQKILLKRLVLSIVCDIEA